jgi:hypothetical protein
VLDVGFKKTETLSDGRGNGFRATNGPMKKEDFFRLVEAIRVKFFTEEARKSREQEFRNHVLFLQQMETFLALNHAIKHG